MEFDPQGSRLPIKVDSASNGEFAPRPLTRLQRAANAHAHALVDTAASRTGLGRRSFLKTLMGSAATLLAFNHDGSFVAPENNPLLPADAPGWPYYMAKQARSSPVVCDLDQDGKLEVIVGEELNPGNIYIFKYDGSAYIGDTQAFAAISSAVPKARISWAVISRRTVIPSCSRTSLRSRLGFGSAAP